MTTETKISPRDIAAVAAKCANYGFINTEVVGRICADYERLRGLIKDAESTTEPGYWDSAWCPWCGAGALHKNSTATGKGHFDECPAFSKDGEVR